MTAISTVHTYGDKVLGIRRVGTAQVPAAAELLARAFQDDPTGVALYPDADGRFAFDRVVLEQRLRRSLRFGHVLGAFDDHGAVLGVAIWIPPGAKAPAIRSTLSTLSAIRPVWRTALGGVGRFARSFLSRPRDAVAYSRTIIEARRAADARPAWLLDYLGTDPDHRGLGAGAALMRHVLERCDVDGLPARLLVANPVNLAYYERFGFEIVARAEGPGKAPTVWFMLREPHPVGVDRSSP